MEIVLPREDFMLQVTPLPELWLLVLLSGLPQLSETVYSPALPEIAKALAAPVSWVEYTLTIYLLGFAIGSFFWGKLSDKYGRKSCIIAGFLVYLLGCIGCYFSGTIEMLMVSRFIQAFGGTVGSILAQAVCRDVFHGPALGKAFSVLGSSLAVFPAVGPIIGGLIAQHYGWSSNFLFLILFGIIVVTAIYFRLPETHHHENRKQVPLKEVLYRMVHDRKLIGLAFLVGICAGISFSYFAEGAFYLIETLGLSPSVYGMTFIGIAMGTLLGGKLSHTLHDYHSSKTILRYGIYISIAAMTIFTICISSSCYFDLTNLQLIIITLGSMILFNVGRCIVISNSLSMAMENYRDCIGTASSFFNSFYWALISLCTFIMGYLHNGTLYPMPIYFLSLSIGMLVVFKIFIKQRTQQLA